MEKMVKICPVCGHENPVDEIYCEICGADLSLVPASLCRQDNAAVPGNPPAAPGNPPAAPAPFRQYTAAPGPVPSPPVQAGRKCRSCSTVSPLNTMVCRQCGSSLATAEIVTGESVQPLQAAPAQSSWMIVSCDNEARLSIAEGQHLLIGWAGELGDYLARAQKDYVSNRHGTLSVIRGELFFEDSSSNGTLINNRPIPRGQAWKLSAGDLLCLGGRPGVEMAQAAYFRVDRR